MLTILLSLACALAAPGEPVPAADVNQPFPQEIPTHFTTADGLPEGPIASLVLLPDGTPVAGAGNALYAFDGSKWSVRISGLSYPARFLAVSDGGLWVAGQQFVARLDPSGKTAPTEAFNAAPASEVTALAPVTGGVLAGTLYDAALLDSSGIQGRAGDRPITALAPKAGGAVAAVEGGDGAVGLYAWTPGGQAEPLPPVVDDRYGWALRNVKAIAVEGDRVWFGADNGAGVLQGGKWTLYTGKEGLPYNRFTCAAPGEAGVVWFGTERGAIRYDGKRWDYRAGLRWLPDDHVNAIAVDPKTGTAWIATNAGVSRIERKPMALAEKAENFERIIDERHRRLDYVVRCQMKVPGDFSTSSINHTDNDGLYTAMYGAAECFRYAATKDPEAKRRAQQAFRGLKFLVDVTGIPGFPARSVVPTDGSFEDPNRHFNAEYNRRAKEEDPLWKEILPRWPKSADGKFWWKCDTSSDEVAGHYFFYGVYYDLVAETPEEKEEVRKVVHAMSTHIVDHNFTLVDHDGLPTRWANWSPEYVNSTDGHADRGLQATEILSFLNTALHVTGDSKFAEAAKRLRDEHAYHVLAISGRAKWPPTSVVPWDDNLEFLSIYPLVKYERDPELQAIYRLALDSSWLFVSRSNDPFFNFVYASMMPSEGESLVEAELDFRKPVEGAIQTLKDTPLLLVGWEMNNSHRLDVELDANPRREFARGGKAYGWSVVTKEALPIQERCHIRINSDHLFLDHSMGGGQVEYEGTFYLLPYYMGLYHGFLK